MEKLTKENFSLGLKLQFINPSENHSDKKCDYYLVYNSSFSRRSDNFLISLIGISKGSYKMSNTYESHCFNSKGESNFRIIDEDDDEPKFSKIDSIKAWNLALEQVIDEGIDFLGESKQVDNFITKIEKLKK